MLSEAPGSRKKPDEEYLLRMTFAIERHLPLSEARKQLRIAGGNSFVELFRHGSLTVELYAPRGRDSQSPHSRDEVYIVAQGSGVFVNGEQRTDFSKGDFLFAAAGEVHRFEDFSDDFATWVLFYGPEGGEAAADPEWATGDD
jgi:mannose-6-phosphate isomerase-like protein (cupin superfamily)